VSRRRRARWRWVALVALAAAAPLPAESLYVIEQLVVGVSSAADASGERIATLKSGDRVEALERAGDQVHVRLASGREGWVRASYLSAEEPLRVRLAQRDAEVARLTDELSQLKTRARADPAPAAAATVPTVAAAAPAPAAALAGPAAEESVSGGLFGAREEHSRTLWPWTLSAGLIGFGIGFGLGALILDRHIRRKYGGLRIY